jgi:RNA polymerase sigma-70 factor (ECF subfamily)
LQQESADIDSIIEGCKKGSRKAQEQLYRLYYRAMASLCLRYTQNDADAVEVLNTGFLKVFQHIQRYEPAQASMYTWIRTIVVNSCLDFVKQRARTQPGKDLEYAADVHIPAEAVLKMNAAELLALVRELPPATAAVFNLYVLEGYSHKEIVQLLGISEGTSKWHLNAARKLLQQRLQKDAYPHGG